MNGARSGELPPDVTRAWEIAQRWAAYAAERRANLLRTIAVGLFYLVHLWSYFSSQQWLPGPDFLQLAEPGQVGKPFHAAVTLVAVAWAMLALAILLMLAQRVFPRWLPYFSTGCDILLLTLLACLGSAARSPLVAGYFLVLALATLRLSLPLLWAATAACAVGYLCVLGCARWPDSFLIDALKPTGAELVVPRFHQLIVMLAIVLTGVVLGQVVRLVRRLTLQSLERGADA